MTHRTAYALSITAAAAGAILASTTHWPLSIPCVALAAVYADLGHHRYARAHQPIRTCDASATGLFGRPVGPCILRQHDGPQHQAANGTLWSIHPATGPFTDAEPNAIIRTQPLTDAETEAFRTRWQALYGGTNAPLAKLIDEDDTGPCTCGYGQRCPNCTDYTPKD